MNDISRPGQSSKGPVQARTGPAEHREIPGGPMGRWPAKNIMIYYFAGYE